MSIAGRKSSGNIHKIREFELDKVTLSDEFDILQIVGEGWFGKILLVEHRATDTEMVLKLLPKPFVSLTDFYKEFHFSLHLGAHKNIVTTYDVAFETAGFYVFTQEYAPLGDLTSNVSDSGIGELHTKRVARQLASAIDYMHQKELIHRDIKLDNVLVFRSDFARIKLCDFGESRRVGEEVLRRNEWLPYSPPEVLTVKTDDKYKTDTAHDVWQFGIVCFVCLTGCLPWQKASVDDPRFYRFQQWHNATLTFPMKRCPKLFKLLSARACKIFKKFLDPRPDRRLKTLSDVQKYLDDRWLAKSAEKEMAENEPDELCPSMYSFHSSVDEKNRLLSTLAQCGIETTVDRVAKKNRIRDWIQSSVIMEEEEEDDSGSATPTSTASRTAVPGHVSSVAAMEKAEKKIHSTVKDASQKHFDPRTGTVQLAPSVYIRIFFSRNFSQISWNQALDFEMNRTTFCRTCGRGGLVYSVPLVHQSEVTGQTVLHMLEYGVGLKLIDDGVFPPQICRLCYGQIVATYELKQTSIESQTCFLQWFPSETLVGVAENLPPDETEMRKEKIVQTEEPASPVDVPPRPEVESPMVDCSIPKDVVFTDNEVQEALISGIAAEIARRAKKAQRAYECKYCDFDTFDKLEYIAHYSVHPEAICCECGFVTNRKFSLRRHLANFRCNESDRFLSPRVRFKRTRTDRAVSLESNNTFVDEALEQVRECLQPEEHTQELSNLERPNIEPEKLSLVASELVIESVKIEPEDASITQSIPKPNQQLPTLENDEDSMEPHMYDSTELDGKIYICQYCPFATLLRNDYLLHFEDHPRVLRCVCGFLTDRAYTLRRHVEKTGCDHSKYSHSGKIYKCQYCSYISTSKSHYVRHWRTHPKNLRCLCGFTTDRKFSLRRHLKTAKCEEIYGKKVDWDDFNKRRTPAYVKNNKPFQLVWLGEGNPELAEEEPSDNNTTNGYKCSYCAHISKDRREYLSHSRTHPKNFQCLCGFETDRRFTFQRHLLKWGCEKAYGKRMDLGPRVSRKARKKAVHTKAQLDSALEAVSSESGATPFEGDIKLEEECLLPEGNTTEPAVHYAADTEGEDLPLSDSDIIIEAVKIEPEDASIFEDISKLSEEYSTPEIHTELISEDNTQKTQKIFTCTYCPFTTVVQTDYMLHYRGHPRVLRCVCGFMTDKQFTLQRHVAISGCNRTVNDELGRPRSSRHWKLFKCRYCSYSSTSRADYVMHWKCHPKVLRCLCGFTTDRKFSLVRHLGVVKCETTYGKKVDWEAYQRGARGWLRNRTPFDISWINVENHEIAIAPEQPQAAPQNKIFKCTLCSYTTTNRQKYRSHYRTHPMNYHCFCGFSTDRKFSLQRHLRKKRCEEIYGKRFDFEQIPSRKRRAKDFINLDSTESTSSKQIEESAIASNSADIPTGSTAAVVAEETDNLEESINQEVLTKLEHHEEGQEDSMNVDLNE